MHGSIGRRLAAGLAVLSLSLVFPAGSAATVNGGCTAEGHASISSGVDLTTEPVWHLRSDETAGGSGSSPTTMTSATLSAYALGIAIKIAGGSGKGDTTGSVDDISLDTFGRLGKVFVIAGSATGGGASCDGQVLIVLDDVDALFTVLGGGGLALAILALAVILLATRSKGCAPKLLATIFGGIGGIGLGLSLEQFQVINPTTPIGLVIVLVGAVLGFFLSGIFGPGGQKEPGPPPPPVPAPAPPPAPGGDQPLTPWDAEEVISDVTGAGSGEPPEPPPPATIAGAVPSTPEEVANAAANTPDEVAPPPAPEPVVTGAVGSTPDEVAKAAIDMPDAEAPPAEPGPNPNAPGVDAKDPGSGN
jgi:hypothetical protein